MLNIPIIQTFRFAAKFNISKHINYRWIDMIGFQQLSTADNNSTAHS